MRGWVGLMEPAVTAVGTGTRQDISCRYRNKTGHAPIYSIMGPLEDSLSRIHKTVYT
jgi:hypothetical protein